MRLTLRALNVPVTRAPLGAQRVITDRAFGTGPLAGGTRLSAGRTGGVPGSWLTPLDTVHDRVLLYLHGGAFILGSSRSHRRLVARLAMTARARAFVPDYRLAPEHPFPAALLDARAVYDALLDEGVPPSSIILAGDSCGAGLALALAQQLRDDAAPLPAVLGLLCPWVDLRPDVAGMRAPAERDPLNIVGVLRDAARRYIAGADAHDPAASPLLGDLRDLPPIVVVSASDDPLAGDAERLEREVRAGEGAIGHRRVDGLWHGFYLHGGVVAGVNETVDRFAADIAAHFPAHGSLRVGIVGAGMSGMCMAARLRDAGYDDIAMYEKADEVGGTWRENRYPGLTCDVPSRAYSYSFAPNPNWTQMMSPGPEILDYFKSFADERDLRRHIRFGAEVTDARWTGATWEVHTADGGTDEVDVLVTATGFLHHPKLPDIKGLDSFAGIARHSAQWDPSIDLVGKRVGVIGTGSTGVQLTTAIAPEAAHLTVFQRTPQWVLTLPNHRYGALTRLAFRRIPALNLLGYRFYRGMMEATLGVAAVQPGWQRTLMGACARTSLRLGVKDPELRAKLTPDYTPLCKRIVISGSFYETMQRDNVALVTDGIDHVEPRGVVTTDGTLHELDVLVMATGFHAHAYMRPMNIEGEDGITLEEAWDDGPSAYRTIALPGFPNLFTIIGPHSPVGNQTIIGVAETQTRYVMRWIDLLSRDGVAAVRPSSEAAAVYNAERRQAAPNTVAASGCQSWYLDEHGVPEIWPWTPGHHREMLREPVLEEFELTRAATRA